MWLKQAQSPTFSSCSHVFRYPRSTAGAKRIPPFKNIFLENGFVTKRNSDSLTEHLYYSRKKENKESKIDIAKTAINYINNNDTIFLDGSSTIEYLVTEILKKDYNLTILTISPIISILLAKNNNFKVICPGGILDNINFIYESEIENFLKSINVNKAFMSCGAFSLEKGFTELSAGEAKIKNTIVNNIAEINILADHEKANKIYSYTWAKYNQVNRLIIDSYIKKDILNKFSSQQSPELVLGNYKI